MRRPTAAFYLAALCLAILGPVAPKAGAQVTTLSKGHQLLVNSGLQIWGLNTDAFQYTFNYNNLTAANMNAVMWSHNQSNPGVLSAGQKWGKWVFETGSPATALNATENAHYADLLAIQVGDEQQTDLENPNGFTKAWFDAAHNGNYFTDKLLYVNSTFVNSIPAYLNFIASANPDAISWDAYPFGTTGVYPYNWLGKAQIFRRAALGNYIGASSSAPRPYGLYLQTYHGGDGARDPGELEMRWQQFTAWTLGYTFADAFTAGGGNTSLFNSGNGNSPHQPYYDQFKETSRQSRNLGPALVKLISYGYGPSIIVGKNASGVANNVPIDWLGFDKSYAPPSQQYLTSVAAQNLGAKNGGQPGDVYVGFFNPLHASYGDPAGTAYFMVTNALGADLQDPALLVNDCIQQITLDFDMGATTINSLQRLRRSDGQVEVVPLTHLSGTTWRLAFNLEGGTGDLFKYNDGNPFVGVQAVQPTTYWDNDGVAAGNNTSTGAGMGGAGSWNGSAKWYNGTSNSPWAANANAVFWGTGGTVTLSAPRSVDSLTFKSDGYTLTASTLTLSRPFVTVDGGVTATIGSAVAGTIGLTKNGAGTLRLTGSNTYSGGTTINGGTVQVNSDAALGVAPASLQTNISLNGGTLEWGANFDLENTRAIAIGPNGGTIDTQGFSNPAGYNATAGGFRGPGDLTKIGSGTFFAAATTGGANTTWKGRLILKEGTWKIIASDGLPYNVPLADGLQADQVTLDGGTWQMGGTIGVTNGRRGITVASGGGTIDTQEFNFTWAGPIAGNNTNVVLKKIGSGILRFTGVASASSYNGIVNINEGTLRLDNGNTMGSLATINLADVAGTTLHITGNQTIGSLAGGGAAGGDVTLSAITLNVGGNNKSTTFGGVISGAGGVTKSGSGTLELTGANTYAGTTTVAGGALSVNGTIAGNTTVHSGAKLGGTGTIGGTTTVQSGGFLSPGNSPGTINLGALTMASSSTLQMELGSTSDQVIVAGTATLAGTLAVSLVGGFTPAVGQTFTLLTANSRSGTFIESLPSFANRTLDVTYDAQNVFAKVVPILAGDFNADGAVNAADYVVWRKGGPGFTQSDYNDWVQNFGRTLPGGGSSSDAFSNVPEPVGGTMVAIAIFLMVGRRNNVEPLGFHPRLGETRPLVGESLRDSHECFKSI